MAKNLLITHDYLTFYDPKRDVPQDIKTSDTSIIKKYLMNDISFIYYPQKDNPNNYYKKWLITFIDRGFLMSAYKTSIDLYNTPDESTCIFRSESRADIDKAIDIFLSDIPDNSEITAWKNLTAQW